MHALFGLAYLSLATAICCAACAGQPAKDSQHSPVTEVPTDQAPAGSASAAPNTDSSAPALGSGGSGSSAVPPFDELPDAELTAYRLQNYAPPAPTQPGAIPGLPPEVQRWAQQGGAGLQQLLPPGLLPPGTQPGGSAAPAPPPPPQNVPRFPNRPDGFRILSETRVIDRELKESLAELLGNANSFQAQHGGCLHAELGLSFTSDRPQPNDVLISFSCNRATAAGGFVWPHPSEGMKPETVSRLAQLTRQLFPPGT